MSLTSLNTKFKLRRDTATNWEIADPVNSLELAIADGEPILAKVDGIYKMKIGDGIHHFAELPYYSGSDSENVEKFIVTFTKENNEWTIDKTIAEVAQAFENEEICVAKVYDGHNDVEIPIVIGQYVNGESYFTGCGNNGESLIVVSSEEKNGSDEFTVEFIDNVPPYSSSNNGQVLGVDDGDLAWVTPESGITSWNDLIDKPFYEEVTPGINLEMPDGGNYVEASFTITESGQPETMPLKLYRAGGVYTTEQLVGATAILDIGETNPYSKGIDSDSFMEIEQDGETVGYLIVGEGVYAIIVLADNTVFNTNVSIGGETVTLTSDNIPSAGTYLINAVIGEDETTCISITKTATTEVHKLDSKFYNGGVSSWNDLTDRPFYETVTSQGYDYEINLDDPNYISGYANIGADVPAKFYRVGDPLTAAQLLGAMGTVNTNGENNYLVIESNYIEEIEDNGDTVGLFVAGDIPYALVVNNDNTTIDIDATNDRPFGFSGTFASAGTYLYWIDLSTMGEGVSACAVSLVKEAESTVTQLPDKYYKAPLIVEITGTTENNMTTYSANVTYSEILAALQVGRPVYARFTDSSNTIMIQAKALVSGAIIFSTMAYIESSIYAIKIEINNQDEISVNNTVFGSAQGVNF